MSVKGRIPPLVRAWLLDNAKEQGSYEMGKLCDDIIQAFADEGYKKLYPTELQDYSGDGDIVLEPHMTGQEWYDRFRKEQSKDPKFKAHRPTYLFLDEAAKKAANIM